MDRLHHWLLDMQVILLIKLLVLLLLVLMLLLRIFRWCKDSQDTTSWQPMTIYDTLHSLVL